MEVKDKMVISLNLKIKKQQNSKLKKVKIKQRLLDCAPETHCGNNLVTFTEEIFNGKFHFLCSDLNELFQFFKTNLKFITKVIYLQYT